MEPSNLTTLRHWGITVLRVVMGIIFLMHGVQKLVIGGVSSVAEFLFQLGMPLPLLIAVAATLLELLGGAALVLGLFTRWVCIALAAGMLIDVLVIHHPYEFFLESDAYEYALLRLSASVALVLAGPGGAALDNILARRKKRVLADPSR